MVTPGDLAHRCKRCVERLSIESQNTSDRDKVCGRLCAAESNATRSAGADGKFQRVTDRAGVAGDTSDWGTGAAFIDYDNDGKLDLFVCNYVRWSPEIDKGVGYSLVGVGRAYGPPTNFQGAFCRLYHNRA